MKRLSLLLACALLLLMAVGAAPAIAGAPVEAPDLGTSVAYVAFPWNGWWFGFDADGGYVEGEPGVPIPSSYDVFIGGGWVGMTLGLVSTIPNYYQLQIAIDGAVTTTFAQSRICWSGAFPTELFPEDGFGPFNPRMGAKPYANFIIIPAGDLAPGTHTLVVTEWMKHRTTDLLELIDDPLTHPEMFAPYTWTFDEAIVEIGS